MTTWLTKYAFVYIQTNEDSQTVPSRGQQHEGDQISAEVGGGMSGASCVFHLSPQKTHEQSKDEK